MSSWKSTISLPFFSTNLKLPLPSELLPSAKIILNLLSVGRRQVVGRQSAFPPSTQVYLLVLLNQEHNTHCTHMSTSKLCSLCLQMERTTWNNVELYRVQCRKVGGSQKLLGPVIGLLIINFCRICQNPPSHRTAGVTRMVVMLLSIKLSYEFGQA